MATEIEKAFIIRDPDNKTSVKYAKHCKETAGNNIPKNNVEYFDSTSNVKEMWKKVKKLDIKIKNHGSFTYHENLRITNNDEQREKAECITLAHVCLWKKISKMERAAAILEHDVVWLGKACARIPDNLIVGLGYKLTNPEIYKVNDRGRDGPDLWSYEIVYVPKILGAHAYAITPMTAMILLEEVRVNGVQGFIDCTHFQGNPAGYTNVRMGMMSPPPAICHIRESTIWDEATTRNGYMIESFTSRLNDPNKEYFEKLEKRII